MKLLYCIPGLYNPGGMERVLTQKVNYLASRGYNIDIVTTEQNGRKPYFELYNNINVIDLNLNFNDDFNKGIIKKIFYHFIKLRKYKKSLQLFINNNNYDIIISLCGKEIEFISSFKNKAKIIGELHFSQNYKEQFLTARNNSFIIKFIGKVLTRMFIKSTKELNRLVVLTKEDENVWNKTNNNIVQIYNSCPFNDYFHHELVIKRFISVGRLDAQKGYDYILDVWKSVTAEFPDWILDIYGQGEWHNLLQNKIKDLRLSKNVFLRGISNNIKEEYRKSYGYILTSRYEGFGMVLVEGMSQGLPCVAFNCKSGPGEIVDDFQNGFLVEVGDVEKMANRIKELIKDPDKRNSFSKASVEKAKLFDQDHIMEQWQTLFKSLCNDE